MHTTKLSIGLMLFALFALPACGAGGLDDWTYDDTYGYDDYVEDVLDWLYKPGTPLAVFPESSHGSAVRAGRETVAFTLGDDHSLIRRGAPVAGAQMLPSGALLQGGELRGFVVYAEREDGSLGVALSTADGRAIRLGDDGAFVETSDALSLAAAPAGTLPLAKPAIAR